jgi:4-amino-4-deoxy-L-arabinose transferase-like glycosyltransferase
MSTRRAFHAGLLVAVVVFGLALRLLGIRMGLPYHHHWDEGWIIDSAVSMLRKANGVPLSFQHGAPLMRLAELGYLATHGWRLPVDLDVEGAQVAVFLAGRTVTALLTASASVAVYWAAWSAEPSRARAPWVALSSALAYAAAWELVLHSRYAMTDASLAALCAWSLAFAGAYLRTVKLRWALASIVVAGVATGFKLPSFLTDVIPILALLARVPPTRRGRLAYRCLLLAAVPLVAVIFVVLNPHVVDHAGDAARDIIGRMKQTHVGGASPIYLRTPGLPHLMSALWAIAGHFLHRSMGVSFLFTAVAIAGLASAVRHKRLIVTIALVHAILVILSDALPNRVFWIRYYIGVTPCLALGFGFGVVWLWDVARDRLAGSTRSIAQAAIAAAVVLGLVVSPLGYALAAEAHDVDPRAAAVVWIARDVGDGSARVGVTPDVFGKEGAYSGLQELVMKPAPRLTTEDLTKCPSGAGRDHGPEYLLNASYRDPKTGDPADPYGPRWFFTDCPGYERVASFGPDPYEYDAATQPNWISGGQVVVLRRTAR